MILQTVLAKMDYYMNTFIKTFMDKFENRPKTTPKLDKSFESINKTNYFFTNNIEPSKNELSKSLREIVKNFQLEYLNSKSIILLSF